MKNINRISKIILPLGIITGSLIGLFSCSNIAQMAAKADQNQSRPTDKIFHLVFSHNISGETHPCGCRQFPLGGLPQVYGLFQSLKSSGELLYVDTGDTFFPSSNIPKSMHESLSFAAKNLAKGLDLVGLQYFVPGDQDFALGINFLKELARTHHFSFLISNLKDESLIKHEKMAIIERGSNKLFLVGLVNPESINSEEAQLFKNVSEAMNEMVPLLKEKGLDPKNPHHRLIILSHAGIELDEKLAQEFPQIDWIIGAHSQSFLRFSQDVGNVKMVQTLSKNHYVGEISINLDNKKMTDSYTLHEIRDELEAKINPNPMRDFINAHKTKMSELQLKEQSYMTKMSDAAFANNKNITPKKFSSVESCIKCHTPQVEFWQSTPHSQAFSTLMNVKEQNNLQCVKCHSLGLGDPRGFTNSKNIIQFKNRPIIDYWNQAHAISSEVKSIRKLNPAEIKRLSKKWMDLDQKSGIKHNFANVQCLNCHDKHEEHPFEATASATGEERQQKIKNKCLTCHTREQSPEWYHKNEKGVASEHVNEKHFHQVYRLRSCPLID